MSEEETIVEETTSQEIEDLVLELDDESDEQDGDNNDADVDSLKAKLAKTEETNKKLYARLKKGEKKVVKSVKSTTKSSLTRDEAILFAKGHTEAEVELATKLSQLNDISLVDASKDPYFTAQVQGRIKKEKSDKASLGASSGTSKHTPQDIGKMSEEDHAKLFHETMGNA